jgi:hypothetical protein
MRALNRKIAFGAMRRRGCLPPVKLNPRNFLPLAEPPHSSLVHFEFELRGEEPGDAFHRSFSGALTANVNVAVSRPGESHPEALAELYVSLSTHTAPITEPRRTPICQWANSCGSRREMRAIHRVARRR